VDAQGPRWDYYRQAIADKTWREGAHVVNNVLRRFHTLCRKAGVSRYDLHDLRRSCITHWAKELPIHVVKELAGHSDIKTTQQFYLSVQEEDVARAQKLQEKMIATLPTQNPTDKEMTNSGRKREFPGRQGCQPKQEPPVK